MTASDTHDAIDAVWRIEAPKLIAGLARIVRDIGVAEDLAQDALVAALEQWPEAGVPRNPGAWLMGVAKHRAIDAFRRRCLERKHEELGANSRNGRTSSLISMPPSTTRATIFTPSSPRAIRSCRLRARRACAAARRVDHRRDRAGVSRLRTDHRPTHRAR